LALYRSLDVHTEAVQSELTSQKSAEPAVENKVRRIIAIMQGKGARTVEVDVKWLVVGADSDIASPQSIFVFTLQGFILAFGEDVGYVMRKNCDVFNDSALVLC